MRRLLLLAAALSASAGAVIACNSADFTPATPKDCSKVECDCEEEPTQPTCTALPGLPEGGLEASTIDAPTLDAEIDSTPPADAADDVADAADE
jgi:hypothetical protein